MQLPRSSFHGGLTFCTAKPGAAAIVVRRFILSEGVGTPLPELTGSDAKAASSTERDRGVVHNIRLPYNMVQYYAHSKA